MGSEMEVCVMSWEVIKRIMIGSCHLTVFEREVRKGKKTVFQRRVKVKGGEKHTNRSKFEHNLKKLLKEKNS
jgi:hypothetical protein